MRRIGNQRSERRLAPLLLAVFAFFLPVSALCDSLLSNGDFSALEADGFPADWYTEAYVQDAGYTVYAIREDDDGQRYAEIKNLGFNDARFAQIVDVEPETLYRFSAEILVENAEEGHGANLSVEGLYAFSEELFDTDGEWITVEWYGETGPEQRGGDPVRPAGRLQRADQRSGPLPQPAAGRSPCRAGGRHRCQMVPV